MENLELWYTGLSGLERVFWTIALVSSFVFIIQAVFTMLGMDTDVDFDTPDFDGDTMDAGGAISLFSVRSLVNFFVGFGWSGITFLPYQINVVLLFVLSTVIGLGFAMIYVLLRRKLKGLERNGAFRIDDCLGLDAVVYLRIPEAGQGKGKVQISINGSIHELNAATDGQAIPTGTTVRVVAIRGGELIVTVVN